VWTCPGLGAMKAAGLPVREPPGRVGKRIPGRCLTPRLIPFLPAILAAATFAGVLANGFVYDDVWTLELIPTSLPGLIQTFPETRSLTYAVHYLDRLVWGDRPFGYHLTNLLLHAMAASLALRLARRLGAPPRAALLAGCLFAVHPVHVEAVASFAFRKDILAMIFVALSLEWWTRGRTRRASLASASFFALALLAKEVAAVALPLLLLPLDRLRVGEAPAGPKARLTGTIRQALPHILILGVAALRFGPELARYFDPRAIRVVTEYRLGSYAEVSANALAAVPQIARLLLFPARLCADYDVVPGLGLGDPPALAGLGLLVLWAVAVLAAWRRQRLLSFGLLWILVLFLPVSNIIPLARTSLAERYLYVPSFGFCLAAGVCLDAAARRARWWAMGWVLLLVVAALGSARRVKDWKDAETLWTSALRAGCSSFRIHNNLGTVLMERGDVEGALREYREATRINPSAPDGQYNLGRVLALGGDLEESAEAMRQALTIDPNHLGALTDLGRTLSLQGRYGESLEAYRKALTVRPDYVPALAGLAWLLARCPDDGIRDGVEAVRLGETALQATGAPRAELLLTLGWAWFARGDAVKALMYCEAAAELARAERSHGLLPSIEEAIRAIRGRRDVPAVLPN